MAFPVPQFPWMSNGLNNNIHLADRCEDKSGHPVNGIQVILHQPQAVNPPEDGETKEKAVRGRR